ncbi:MAG TPA: hypothetical protein VL053_10055 [Arachidicoccus sp.]|nr:hypothetical protein [Arachidicoccus sp.]
MSDSKIIASAEGRYLAPEVPIYYRKFDGWEFKFVCMDMNRHFQYVHRWRRKYDNKGYWHQKMSLAELWDNWEGKDGGIKDVSMVAILGTTPIGLVELFPIKKSMKEIMTFTEEERPAILIYTLHLLLAHSRDLVEAFGEMAKSLPLFVLEMALEMLFIKFQVDKIFIPVKKRNSDALRLLMRAGFAEFPICYERRVKKKLLFMNKVDYLKLYNIVTSEKKFHLYADD